jgi:hypothetical protein
MCIKNFMVKVQHIGNSMSMSYWFLFCVPVPVLKIFPSICIYQGYRRGLVLSDCFIAKSLNAEPDQMISSPNGEVYLIKRAVSRLAIEGRISVA